MSVSPGTPGILQLCQQLCGQLLQLRHDSVVSRRNKNSKRVNDRNGAIVAIFYIRRSVERSSLVEPGEGAGGIIPEGIVADGISNIAAGRTPQ